jgi:hypothetical protein
MELLDSDDPKHQLLRKSAKHKQELEHEVKLLSENTEKIVKNALIIGGTLAVGYLLVRQFSKSSKRKSKSKSKKIRLVHAAEPSVESAPDDGPAQASVMSQVGSALAAQATVFLLDLAKDKLADFLKTHFDKKEEPVK